MKTSLLAACGLFYYLFALAQVKPPSLCNLPSVTIRLNQEISSKSRNSVFSHFEVIDQRPDTGRIGLHINKAAFVHARDRQLVFPRPASIELAHWLNQHFTRPDAPYTGLIVLRSLWLSDANYALEDLMRDPHKQQERTHIRLKAEVYAGKDSSYWPVFRFDTLSYTIKAVYSIHSPYSDWERDLEGILGDLASSASFLADQKQDFGRRIPLEAIQEFNQSRFVLPIDGMADLTQGVYASFEELRNNNPSIRNFELKMEGSNLLLYVKQPNGRSYYSHDAWGYCDGKNLFVMKDGVLRLAWKEGRAFYFSSALTAPSAVISSNMNLSSRSRYIYTIDMDTGSIY